MLKYLFSLRMLNPALNQYTLLLSPYMGGDSDAPMELNGGELVAPISLEGTMPLVDKDNRFLETYSGELFLVTKSTRNSLVLGDTDAY